MLLYLCIGLIFTIVTRLYFGGMSGDMYIFSLFVWPVALCIVLIVLADEYF